MIKASQMINEISINFPKSVDKEIIEEIVHQILNDINSSYEDDIQYSTGTEVMSVYIMGKDKDYKLFLDRIEKIPLLTKYGWFIRHAVYKDRAGVVVLEPVYHKHAVKPPRYLYHATQLENLDEILEQGLVPMLSVGKFTWHDVNYPPRIYFMREVELIYKLDVMLQIDTSLLKNTKFYKDALWRSSLWTNTVIPPEVIEEIS